MPSRESTLGRHSRHTHLARLIDRFGYEDGRWGIRHRALRWDWNHDMATAEGWIFGMLAPETSLKKSKKFPDDLIYTRQTQEHS